MSQETLPAPIAVMSNSDKQQLKVNKYNRKLINAMRQPAETQEQIAAKEENVLAILGQERPLGFDVNLFHEIKRQYYTLFMIACKEGLLEVAEILRGLGASPQKRKNRGNNAMILAIFKKQHHILRYLLKLNFNPNSITAAHYSAIYAAIEMQDKEAIKILIEEGDVNLNPADKFSNKTPLEFAKEFFPSTDPENIEFIKLFEEKASNSHPAQKKRRCARRKFKGTLDHYASRSTGVENNEKSSNSIETEELIIIEEPPKKKARVEPPIVEAPSRSNFIFNFPLTNQKYNLLEDIQKNNDIQSILDQINFFSRSGKLNKDNINSVSFSSNKTLLTTVVELGKTPLVELFITLGANVNQQNGGITPVHSAVIHEHIDSLKCLLSAGADPNTDALHGITPLFLAVQKNNVEAFETLRQNGAEIDITKKHSKKELTLLDVATDNSPIKEYLIQLQHANQYQSTSTSSTFIQSLLFGSDYSIFPERTRFTTTTTDDNMPNVTPLPTTTRTPFLSPTPSSPSSPSSPAFLSSVHGQFKHRSQSVTQQTLNAPNNQTTTPNNNNETDINETIDSFFNYPPSSSPSG